MSYSMPLRTQLLLLIGGPLLLLMLIESMVSYLISMHAANLVLDRWLLNSVQSIAREVHHVDGRLRFTADPTTLEIFEWDDMDRVHFQVATPHGQPVAGTLTLAVDWSEQMLQPGPYLRDVRIEGVKARAVSILTLVDGQYPAVVTVAETLNRRQNMTAELLREVLISKALLLLAVMLLIGAAFDRGLRPLIQLSRELGQRTPHDLTLIEVGQVPGEVRGLIENTNQLLSRIDTAISAREQFIGNIAHQIRTPLAGMKLQAQLALEDDDMPRIKQSLEKIARAADHMAHVNAQLMKLARAEAAFGRGLRSEQVDLCYIVRSCCEELADYAAQRQINLRPVMPDYPMLMDGELTLLKEMVGNLIENAITYGHPDGSVWITVEDHPIGAILVVEDDGPGITPDNWPQIFERFFRPIGTKGDGCGLGLAIVREIALAHGASVHLEDRREGPGARFVVQFS
jgi:two-component system sensor histidine kinase TctE